MTAAEPFPPIEPYDHGLLDVGDGNLVYWETCGNPAGKPALVVHGGPGSGCGPGSRRYFDPERYRIVLFDQRGCGRSLPHASDPAVDLSANTTHHLIADMERLREQLGIERWLLYGGSWGSTLILAYAERYPERVSEVVILGVTMTRRSDIDWLYRGVGRFFPADWDRFRRGVPEADRDGDLVAAYARLLESPDADVRARATSGLAHLGGRRDLARVERLAGGLQRPAARRRARVRPHLHALLLARRVAGGGRAAGARRSGWPASRACSSTAASTWARRSAPPGSWHRRGRDPSSSSSTTPATPAATRCASSRCRRRRVSALDAEPPARRAQAVTAVTTPATNATREREPPERRRGEAEAEVCADRVRDEDARKPPHEGAAGVAAELTLDSEDHEADRSRRDEVEREVGDEAAGRQPAVGQEQCRRDPDQGRRRAEQPARETGRDR